MWNLTEYYIYSCVNKINGKVYIGKTKNPQLRKNSHLWSARNGSMLPLHCAIRKYGAGSFKWRVNIVTNEEEVNEIEKIIISAYEGEDCYNIAPGGEGGFYIRDSIRNEWISKLKEKRIGKKPALGMKHSEENKRKFSESSKKRWDECGRYPREITKLAFKQANKTYGISRTHYYRLKKEIEVSGCEI